ncbi:MULTISPECIES: DNA polymerase III subunit delta' [Pseudanabaena]|uniref:DNA polymerase III, delta prime subunit n=1 Tax=Pseudanabaena biceps PCC 7429 TaxID=927668 RepID=L8MZQ5_9CYAN|nr:DNA polymerase III subunit delta' [Pseudanabaena biceps]ELS32244.1 DNA polymerase III, delta prime subunit [Pseudanabaena biceps PCC 7429]
MVFSLNSPFDVVVGQNQAIKLLKAAIQRDRIAPAYLFAGTSGVGRSKTASAFAEILLGDRRSANRLSDRNHPDLLWVEPTYLDKGKMLTAKEADAAGLKRRALPQIRIEQIREISEFVSRPPLECQRSVVVLEEAQSMAESAANSLLKTLEEPLYATIILIVPDASAILPTLVSRCQRIPFTRLNQSQLQEVLVLAGHTIPPEVLALAQGSAGNAIESFERFKSIPAELLTAVRQIPQDAKTAMAIAKQITKELEVDLQLWLIDYLQNYFWEQQRSPIVLQHLDKARELIARYVQPRLVWEVTLLQIAGKIGN